MSVQSAAQKPRSPAHGTLRPEYRLLLSCAQSGPSQQARTAADLLGQPLDWRFLLGEASTQHVSALCYPGLLALGATKLPAEILESFRSKAMATAARNLRLAAKLVEITSRAEASGIPLVPYKGAVLAEMAYGNLGLRQFVDLDFILPHRALPSVWNLLQDIGYQPENPALSAPRAPIPGEYLFLAPGEDFHLELHTDLTLRHFPTALDLEPLLSSREAVTLAGRRVLTFSREDSLTLLAVHGGKDFWSRLLWICDIAALFRTQNFDWDRALERSRRMGCRRMVHVALLLAEDLLEATIPGEVARIAETDAVAQGQAQWLVERLFGSTPIGRWEQLRYRMRMIEGVWPSLRYAARLATTPADEDWNALRLPAPLGFAYALLRPLRLFRR